MNLLTTGLSLVALGSGYSLTRPLSDPVQDQAAAVGQAALEASPACESSFDDLAEVPAGEFDPLSIPMEDGIVWYGTWEGAMAERDRTGKPILLHFGSPRRPKDMVCVPGAW